MWEAGVREEVIVAVVARVGRVTAVVSSSLGRCANHLKNPKNPEP